MADGSGEELPAAALVAAFEEEYLARRGRFSINEDTIAVAADHADAWSVRAELREGSVTHAISGRGNGPIDAFVAALRTSAGVDVRVVDYHEHAVGDGADAAAIAYVQIATADGVARFGVGRASSIVTASLQALVGALNRVARDGVALREPTEPRRAIG
jgi:2-isopropylmalate synthase